MVLVRLVFFILIQLPLLQHVSNIFMFEQPHYVWIFLTDHEQVHQDTDVHTYIQSYIDIISNENYVTLCCVNKSSYKRKLWYPSAMYIQYNPSGYYTHIYDSIHIKALVTTIPGKFVSCTICSLYRVVCVHIFICVYIFCTEMVWKTNGGDNCIKLTSSYIIYTLYEANYKSEENNLKNNY